MGLLCPITGSDHRQLVDIIIYPCSSRRVQRIALATCMQISLGENMKIDRTEQLIKQQLPVGFCLLKVSSLSYFLFFSGFCAVIHSQSPCFWNVSHVDVDTTTFWIRFIDQYVDYSDCINCEVFFFFPPLSFVIVLIECSMGIKY